MLTGATVQYDDVIHPVQRIKSSKRKMDQESNTTDCKGRLLAYEYGLLKIPARAPQLESFDALELATTCGVTRPTEFRQQSLQHRSNENVSLRH